MRRLQHLMAVWALIPFMLTEKAAGQEQGKPNATASRQSERVNDPSWLRERLQKVRKRYDLPYLGAVVVMDNKVVAASAVGVRKYGTKTPVTQNDPFHLGSITKVMTATLVGMLIDDKVLRWDTTMAEMFPELAAEMQPGYRNVTVLQLLSHTGGFPYAPSMAIDAITAAGENPSERRYAYVRAAVADVPAADAGSKTIYSGGGIVAVSYIERKTRKQYEQLMRNRLFRPLGMKTAGIDDHMAAEGKANAPWGHRQDRGKTKPIEPDHHSPINGRQPVGGAYCSMPDLGRFLLFQLQGARGESRLIKAETFAVLQTAVPGGNFAPGWSVETPDWAKGKVLAHSGSTGIHVAICWVVPEENYAVAVGTNAAGEPRADEALAEVFRYLTTRVHHNDAASPKLAPVAGVKPVPPAPEIWLDDLKPSQARVGFGEFHVGKTDNGKSLVLDGDAYTHGLNVHAESEVIYELEPEYKRFVARVGPEERASWRASVVAKVYCDQQLLDTSPLLRAGDPPWNIDVALPLSSADDNPPRQLRLVITDGGDGINSDWCDWVDAGFLTDTSPSGAQRNR